MLIITYSRFKTYSYLSCALETYVCSNNSAGVGVNGGKPADPNPTIES